MKRQIVFWLPQGRIGNLIFQYQAAISLFGERSTVISLESEFSNAFEKAQFVKIIPLPKVLRPRATKYWANVLRWCAKKKIFGLAEAKREFLGNDTIETAEITRKSGYFSNCWVFEGYFQNDHYATPTPKLKQGLIDKAEIILCRIPKEKRVAVHIRLGDYAQWTVLGKPGVSLPRQFYKFAMAQIAKKIDNPVFVIFSDDKEAARNFIGGEYETFDFNGGSPIIDLAGISICSHAIISASTFSWWGAFLISSENKIVLAPKYWAGYKSSVWYPSNIQTKYFKYIEVAECGE